MGLVPLAPVKWKEIGESVGIRDTNIPRLPNDIVNSMNALHPETKV